MILLKPAICLWRISHLIFTRDSLRTSSNGFQTARAISILQTITGNIDLIGGARLNKPIPLSEVVMIERIFLTENL